MELKDEIHEEIVRLCEDGDSLIEDNKFEEANVKYNNALELVPSPKSEWEASTWIYTALGDSYFLTGNYKKAKDCFYNAMNCPDGITNPFILLRIGQSLFECGELARAKEFLLKAFMLEGINIFTDEDEKYLKLIDENIYGGNSKETPRSLLKDQIESLMDKSNDEYDEGNYIESIEFLIDAWDKLPNPKGIYAESFHIVKYISETYLLINDANEAKVWSDKIFQCDLNRMDCGEREFLAGKVAYELGDLDTAKKFFVSSNQKSDGRCFEDEEIKYFNFFKK